MTQNSKYWLCQIGGWGAFLSVNVLLDIWLDKADFVGVLGNFLFVLTGLLLTHLFRNYINNNQWKILPLEKLIPRVLLGIFIADIILAAEALLYTYFLQREDYKPLYVFIYMVNIFILLSVWSLAYFVWSYIERNRRLQIEKLQMEAAVKSLELKNIKANLQPHFIFNSLNSIRALVDENPIKAREAVTQLSNILRSSITADKTETVTLKKELEVVKDYLALERIRFEERLQIQYDIAENTLDIQIPTLILQSIIENAIKHGIAAQDNGGSIYIRTYKNTLTLNIEIENTGQIKTESSNEQINSSGFGLNASKIRLQHYFGKHANLLVANKSDSIVITHIIIPLK